MTKEVIFKVNTQEAVKSIGDLQVNIKALKEKLKDSSLTWDEQQKYVKQLAENQAALRNAMHGTSATFGEVITGAKGANIVLDKNGKIVNEDTYSYNQLSRTLTLLKEQFHSTTNAAERLQVAQKINAVNDKLKALDASVGTYGRNVGNYIGAVDHLTASFGSMGRGAMGVITPIKNATGALKVMSTTPAIAVLGILANVLQKVIEGLKSSEENTQAMTAALAPFQAIGDAVTKVLQGMGTAIVKVVEGFNKLTASIFGANDASKERLRLAQEEADLAKQQRETTIANAEAEKEVARLRAEASDKINNDATRRIALLEEAGKKEREISARAVEDAKKQYEIIRDKNALTESSKEELDQEAQAYAAMIQAETSYYKKVREINAGITEAKRAEAKAARDAAKAVKDAATAKLNAEKEYLSQILSLAKTGTEEQLALQEQLALKEKEIAEANARQKITDAAELARTLAALEKAYEVKVQKLQQDHNNLVTAEEVKAATNRANAFRKGSVEYLAAMEEVARLEYDKMERQMDESDAAWDARRLEAARKLAEAMQSTTDAVTAEGRLALENEMNALAEGSVQALAKATELARYNLDNLHQQIDESDDAFAARRIAAQKALTEAMEAEWKAREDQDLLARENELNALEEGSIAYLAKAVELKKYELDTLHQLEDESEAAFQARRLAKQKEVEAAEQSHYDAMASIVQSYAGGLTDIMGSIADIIENGSEVSEAEAKKVKNLRVGAAIVDTISGAIAAYMNTIKAVKDPVTGNILAAVQAAAVTAAGMANVAKIRSTNISTTSSGSGADATTASVQAPSITPEVTQVRSVTSASEEDRLNQMASSQRVYILQSDLEASTEQTKVRVSETTF